MQESAEDKALLAKAGVSLVDLNDRQFVTLSFPERLTTKQSEGVCRMAREFAASMSAHSIKIIVLDGGASLAAFTDHELARIGLQRIAGTQP